MPPLDRDTNNELSKTRGMTWLVVRAARSILTDPSHVKDPYNAEISGLRDGIEVIADRLDDQCRRNEEANAEVFRLWEEVARLQDEIARLRAEVPQAAE
jgi:hypothetical protein